MNKIEEVIPANTRRLGKVVRETLREMGLDWKVQAKTVSFTGFGYGEGSFAEVHTQRRLTYCECRKIAIALRALRKLPVEEGGGAAIVSLRGADYPFGGAINARYFPEGADFWRKVHSDLNAKEFQLTAELIEANRLAAIAYAREAPEVSTDKWYRSWIEERAKNPEASAALNLE